MQNRHVRVKSHSKSKPVQVEIKPEIKKVLVLDSFKSYQVFENHPRNSINRYTVSVQDMPSWYAHDSFIVGSSVAIIQKVVIGELLSPGLAASFHSLICITNQEMSIHI